MKTARNSNSYYIRASCYTHLVGTPLAPFPGWPWNSSTSDSDFVDWLIADKPGLAAGRRSVTAGVDCPSVVAPADWKLH